jgi:hypothetical protein
MSVGSKVFLGIPIFLFVDNPPPGFGSIVPVQLKVVKSCGTTTC